MTISIQTNAQSPAPAPAEPVVSSAGSAQHSSPQASAVQAPAAPKVNVDPQRQREELSQAIARLNEMMSKQGRDLSFSMDEKLNRTIIQVRSTSTGEVVRQIPDETVLKVAHSIEDLKGLLLNERS